MITNREEVIDKAFKVFLRMNYEKASISTLAKACGVVKTGVVYYFPHKLDLFMAVADKYVIQMQTPANKFASPTETLAEFIEQYVAGVVFSPGYSVGYLAQEPYLDPAKTVKEVVMEGVQPIVETCALPI